MLTLYQEVLGSLDQAERKLLSLQVNELKRVMRPGFTRLNWNSLGFTDFISRCNLVRVYGVNLALMLCRKSTNCRHC